MEPRFGHSPIAPHRGRVHAHHFGRFIDAQPAKKSQLDDPAFPVVHNGELRQRGVQFHKLGRTDLRGNLNIFQRNAFGLAPTFRGDMSPGVIDKNSSHELRGDPEKLGAILPLDAALVDHAQIHFVDERGGLQSVVAAFPL